MPFCIAQGNLSITQTKYVNFTRKKTDLDPIQKNGSGSDSKKRIRIWTKKADPDPTQKTDPDPTQKADLDHTQKQIRIQSQRMDPDPTQKPDLDPTQKKGTDLKTNLDPTPKNGSGTNLKRIRIRPKNLAPTPIYW